MLAVDKISLPNRVLDGSAHRGKGLPFEKVGDASRKIGMLNSLKELYLIQNIPLKTV